MRCRLRNSKCAATSRVLSAMPLYGCDRVEVSNRRLVLRVPRDLDTIYYSRRLESLIAAIAGSYVISYILIPLRLRSSRLAKCASPRNGDGSSATGQNRIRTPLPLGHVASEAADEVPSARLREIWLVTPSYYLRCARAHPKGPRGRERECPMAASLCAPTARTARSHGGNGSWSKLELTRAWPGVFAV